MTLFFLHAALRARFGSGVVTYGDGGHRELAPQRLGDTEKARPFSLKEETRSLPVSVADFRVSVGQSPRCLHAALRARFGAGVVTVMEVTENTGHRDSETQRK